MIWDDLKWFKEEEFGHPTRMDWGLLRKLDKAREIANTPFSISTSYREGDPKSHGLGKAVDIRCHRSFERFLIVEALLQAGFKRIGIYDRHIHADVGMIHEGFPSPRIWWGKSK